MSGEVRGMVQIHQDRQELREFLTKRHLSTSEVDQAIDLITQFDKYLAKPANQATINETRAFIQHHAGAKKDPERNLTYLYLLREVRKKQPHDSRQLGAVWMVGKSWIIFTRNWGNALGMSCAIRFFKTSIVHPMGQHH